MAGADEVTGLQGREGTASRGAVAAFQWARPLVVLSDLLERVTQACYVAATAAFAAIMLLGIFFRYVLNASLSWADELALILFVWATFLSVASCYWHGKHVNTDVFVRALPSRWQPQLALVAEGLAGAYLVCLLVSGVEALELAARAQTDALRVPLTVPYLAIPVAGGLMLVHWVGRNATDTRPAAAVIKLLTVLSFFWLVYLPLGQYVQLAGPPRFVLLALSFAIPLFLGVPVAFGLGLVATMYVALFGTVPFHTGALQVFFGIDILTLLAIPLLILSGSLMHAAGMAGRIVDFAQVLVGRVRGGLGAANVVASLIFADISGSSVSDTAAIGSIMIPEMKRRAYRADFCAALQGASGTLGLMFPPAITLLLFAIATNLSVGRLFAASILPGFLVAFSFMVVAYLHARRHGYPTEDVPRHLIPRRIAGAVPVLLAVIVVVGGLLGGVFTPAEVGTILLVYVLGLSIVLYRGAGPGQLYRATIEAGHVSGMTLFMVSTSAFLGFVLVRDLVSLVLVDTVSRITANKLVVIFLVSLVFIVLGMVLEAAPMIFGFLPSFMPVLQQVGVDPVHWGVLFIINMGLGMLIPPIAMNLFISSSLAGVRYEEAVRAAVPFILIMSVDLVLVALIPELALLLPHLLYGHPLR